MDKYIEYDPVIVMIDLVLMSKEAQRHVLYNTEFKVSTHGLINYIILISEILKIPRFKLTKTRIYDLL